MISPWFVYVGAAAASVGIVLYAIAMFRGQARPNRVTWLLWSIIPLVTFFASRSEGAGTASMLTLAIVLGDFSIFVLSFFVAQSYWRTSRLDLTCGALSALAVALWVVTRDGTVALVLSLVADSLACAPTLVKSYQEPESEHALTYVLSGLGALLTMLTITDWTLANGAFAVYLLAMDLLIVLLITVVHRRPMRSADNAAA